MYQYILFDLDGTITDSREGITKSVQFALAKYGIDEPDLRKLEKFIGPPLRDSFLEFYPEIANEETVEKIVETYRSYYKPTGIYENKVFDGIPELLKTLHQSGRKLAVASSKPEVFVRKIIKYFSLENYFEVIVGSLLDGTRENKKEIVAEALQQLCGDKVDLEHTAMVGDRKFDIEGAKDQKVAAIGVRFGFSKLGELEEAGADFIAETVEDLEKHLLS